ncbi:hypothetical protein EWB00_004154 [Schistosoma japonicum]|uniref:Ig-like domain-containing protein n=1 Tax=Schistosoma japonicum TaxID=6182 RepID=A0A4Z2DUR4_SCHJA|nr:hypothetical protein KSF78_0003567 [Schistosoma japonicum]TNN20293.1 hypothetical protein EWB00_004154 [Schistosoma japonicum]
MNTLLLLLFLVSLNFCLSVNKHGKHENWTPNNHNISSLNMKMDEVTLVNLPNKTWSGPFSYDILIGSMINLPCTIDKSKIEHIFTRRNNITNNDKESLTLLWIHNTWTNVIDPWLGDGRRSYNPLEINQWNISSIDLLISQAHLSIIDIDPTDVGVYACVMVFYPIHNGYSPLDLKQIHLLSIHMIRVRSNLIVAPECHDDDDADDDDDNDFENEIYCKTGFEQWTFNVYNLTGGWLKNEILFNAPCNADIFLTAVAMSDVDPTLWSIGWYFIPYGEVDNSKVVEINKSSNGEWLQPMYKYVEDSSIPSSSFVEFIENITNLDNNNLLVGHIRASTYWKAHWLALNNSIQQKSGVWQCWILRSVAHKNSSLTTDIPIRWLTNEVHVKIIPRNYIHHSGTIIELWRLIVLTMAPLNVFLLFLLLIVGWFSTDFYQNKCKPEENPNINTFNIKEGTQPIQQQEESEEQILSPYQYVDELLRKSGIISYKEYIRSRIQK